MRRWPKTSCGPTARYCSPTLRTDALLDGLDLPGVRVVDVAGDEWAGLLAAAGPLLPHREVEPTDTLMMIFTSGTSGEPKAVRVTHLTVIFAGANLIERFDVDSSGVCYLSMPLFHSNALLAGWSVAVGSGAAMVPATFSASGLLADLRRYGATYMNYVGKPLAYVLATPELPDDRGQPAAGRIRQRGKRPRHRRVQPPLRLHGLGRLRLHRRRDHHHPRRRLPAGLTGPGLSRRRASTTPTRSPNARWPNSTTTAR